MNNIWLIGLGGIGKALELTLMESLFNVTVFSSKSKPSFDITCEKAINAYVNSVDALPDAVIITTGMLYDDKQMPEKSIVSVDWQWLEKSIKINVLTTLYFAKAITKRLKRSDNVVFACFSARVSSISDNRLGGWHSYRMSKSMLNMLIKNIALEWKIKSPQSIIFGYHPGTVDTFLSKPFQGRVKENQLFTVEQAANYFLECLSTRTIEHSGHLFDWQKTEVMP